MKKRAPKLKAAPWHNHLNIGYAMENDADDGNTTQPQFSFVGATVPLLYDVFRQLTAGGYVCSGFRLGYVRSGWQRGRHHMLWRLRVVLDGFNTQFLSLGQLRLMIENAIRSRGHRAKFFKIDTLLNL